MDKRFRLRKGSEKDLPALAALDSSFGSEWVLLVERRGGLAEQAIELHWRRVKPPGSRRRFEEDVESLASVLRRSERLIIGERHGRMAGYLMLGTNWNRTAELVAIVVDANHRRQGLGKLFIQEAEAFAREQALRALQWETQNDNRNALEFALSQGFRMAGSHDAFYENRGYERQEAPHFRGLALFLTRELQ